MNRNINMWWRRVRMWLATTIAPAGATVHDRVGPLDEELLAAICWGHVREAPGDRLLYDAQYEIRDLADAGLVHLVPLGLTREGEIYLAKLWGDDIMPPGQGGYLGCHDHGVYDAGPGDPWACPNCPPPPAAKGRGKSLILRALGRVPSHPL
jgi:hypothetical protein